MKKVLLLVLGFIALIASDSTPYIGVGIGQSSFSIDGIADSDSTGTSGTLILGAKYAEYSRFYVMGTYIDRESSVDNAEVYSAAYDLMLPLHDRFSLYLGPVAGYTVYKTDFVDLSGFHYGAEVGGTFKIVNNVEIEAGARYLEETGSQNGLDADNVEMFYFQLNYFFDVDPWTTYN